MDITHKDADMLGVFKNKYCGLWWTTSLDFPDLEGLLGKFRHSCTEGEMDSIIEGLFSEVKRFGKSSNEGGADWSSRVKSLVRRAGKCILGLSDSDMDLLLDGGFLKTASEFMDKAREFDPAMELNDMTQAIRNVWVMNCIQHLFGIKVKNTPSVFSYSMLYPYTDNYLDRPGLGGEEKAETGRWFRARLEGREARPSGGYQEGLSRLIGMIEGEFPRNVYGQVYKSLLDIHDAQQKSLLQQKGCISPYELNIPDISFQKGGTSVLADAWLIKGSLTAAEMDFMFGFGAFLQLPDDLQDAATDMENGHMTMFSQTAGKWPLDNITNRLFNFSDRVLGGVGIFCSPEANQLIEIMQKSCAFLILSAIACNDRLYSRDYLRRIEVFSPLSFSYIRGMYRKLDREYKKLKRVSGSKPVENEMMQVLAQGC